MSNHEALLPVAHKAVDKAAELIRSRSPGELTAKGDRDYASEMDFAIEREVRDFLRQATPDIGFLGEEEGSGESSSELGQGLWWMLDPIDGTVNFAHALPLCAISLGLVSDGRPVLGVVDLPFLSSRYSAVEGQGAYRDDQRLHVSHTARLCDAVVTIGDYAVGENAQQKNRERLALTEQLASKALRVRMLGSAAIDLCWVAEGKSDASITLSNLPWDIAAGVLIAREAGALVVDSAGRQHTLRSNATIASGPALAATITAITSTLG